jgi:WD40 repeat protein
MVKQFYVGVPSWVRWALVALGLYFFFAFCIYPFTSLPQQAEYRLSNRLHEVRGGEAVLVIPAETGIGMSNMSPDGKWLVWSSAELEGSFVRNLETGEDIEITDANWGNQIRWLPDGRLLTHSSSNYWIVEFPSQQVQELLVIDENLTNSQLEEKFSPFSEVVGIEFFSSTNSAVALIAFDHNPPLVYAKGLSTQEVEALSATLYQRPWANYKEPHMSPNGRYSVQIIGQDCCAFHVVDSQTGEEVAYVRRDGRYARILGWSPDSTAVYFKFEVGGASGGILHPYEPVFKLVLDAPQSGVAPLPNSHVQGRETAVPFWLLPLIGMGALGLLYYRPNWTKATGIGGVVLLLTTLSITSCIAIGPSPNFDPEALDVQGGQLEIVIPAEHYISEAQVSPDGKWLYYGYEAVVILASLVLPC